MLVVIDQRRVQRAAAENAGADEIPERRADDVGIGEPVFELPLGPISRCCWIASMISSTSGSTSINENMLPIGTHRLGPAGPVEVMAGADHAAEEDQDQLEIDRALGELARHQAHRHQQIGAHAGGEELERLLDP